MQRFLLKCQSCFLPWLIQAVAFGQIVVLGALLPPPVYAETSIIESAPAAESEEQPSAEELEPLPLLPAVVVLGERNAAPAGATVLSQEEIERLPARNGSVNELLMVLPGVQVGDTANLSTRAGEITPPALSISGGKTYQNNFQIDGQGVNLILDPLNAASPDNPRELPTSSQGLYVNKSLVKEITVYDHNVSAQYGGFAGGVVDLRTRDPEHHLGGNASYRTTRDGWTRFHVKDEEAFSQSNTHDQQPRFEKYEAGLTLDLPLTENIGILAAHQRLESTIPLIYFAESKEESRQLENYFFKLVANPLGDDRLEMSLIATPVHGDYVRSNVWAGDYEVDTNAVLFSSEYRKYLRNLDLSLRGSYGVSATERTAPLHFKTWNANWSDSKSWGKTLGSTISNEGGYGDLTNRQETLQLGTRLETTRDLGMIGIHHINTGIDYARVVGEFRRPQTSYLYSVAKQLSVTQDCAGDTYACIDGEQYLSWRQVYSASDATARLNRYSAYLEDTVTLGRLEVRPGVRASRDDYMRNTNVAPRFSATLDVFGGRTTELTVGANRYYSETLLAGKLREAILPLYRETRASVTAPWLKLSSDKKVNRYADLNTPYVDEVAAGIAQSLAGGRLVLDYIHRQGKDQFATELGAQEADGLRYYVLTNQGRTHYESWRLGWQRSWLRHEILANLSWQKSKTNAESYLDRLDDETLDREVYYHGKVLALGALPQGRENYNHSWVGNLVYTGKLPLGFEFTNLTRYRSGYEVLRDTNKRWTAPDGVTKYNIYDEEQVPESWLFDWILTWRQVLPQHQQLAISLEVYNVFDREIQAGTAEDEFELGRQFWAGAEYRF